MKAKKAVKRLNGVEALLSNVIDGFAAGERAVKELLDNAKAPWNKPAYTQVSRGDAPGGGGAMPNPAQDARAPQSPSFMGRSVRTERWRYTEWDEGRKGVELYDHDNDPHEYHNLADDPASANTIEELKRLLHPPPPGRVRK